jgi:transposase-like protein
MIKAPNYTAEFKVEVIKALLFNIAVTSEFSSRYGVPPVQVRRWIRETARHLDEIFENVEQSAAAHAAQASRLSPGELDALLQGYEHTSAAQ